MTVKSLSQVAEHTTKFGSVSFDLFDTLIYRKRLSLQVIKEAAASLFMGLLKRNGVEKLLTVDEVLESRTHFTILLKGSFSCQTEEPDICAVYKAMATAYGLSPDSALDVAEKTARTELGLDLFSLDVMSGAKDLLAQLSKADKRLYLVSDMYYPRDYIIEILKKLGLDNYFEQVLVSATSKKTKQTGNLYVDLVDGAGCQADQIIHIGDNFTSDYTNATAMGLQALYFNSDTHNYAEKNFSAVGDTALDKFAGLSIHFVLQVLQRAVALGLERVYFLTRDATSLQRLLSSMVERSEVLQALTQHIEIRELAVSRSSATFMELSSNDTTLEEILYRFCWVFDGSFELARLLEFARNAGLDPEALELPGDLGATKIGVNIEQEAQELRDRHPETAKKIVDSALQLGSLMFEYLLQERVVGDGPVGFVDVGYTATVSRNIAHYLIKEAPTEIASKSHIHLFFMTSGVLLEQNLDASSPYVSLAYLMNKFDDMPTILRTNYSWFECYAKDYGRGILQGYTRNDDKLVASFAELDGGVGPLDGWIESSDIGESQFLSYLSEQSGKKVLRRFFKEMSFPSVETIDYIDHLNHGCGLLDSANRSILNRNVQFADFLPNGIRNFIREDYWIAGSIKASGFGSWAVWWVGAAIDSVRTVKKLIRTQKRIMKQRVKQLGRFS